VSASVGFLPDQGPVTRRLDRPVRLANYEVRPKKAKQHRPLVEDIRRVDEREIVVMVSPHERHDILNVNLSSNVELCEVLPDQGGILSGFLHDVGRRRPPGDRLDGKGPGSGEEVHDGGIPHGAKTDQRVEDRSSNLVHRRPGIRTFRTPQLTTTQGPGNHSHDLPMLRAAGPISFRTVNSEDSPSLRLVMTGPEKAAAYRPQRKIDDIRGIATVKRNLLEIIEEIRNREEQRPQGWLGGVLFYGPQGCGKVFAAEVISSELDADMYLFDVGAGWDRKVFEQAVQDAVNASLDQLVTVHFENVDSPAATELRTTNVLEMLDAANQRGNVVITASAILPWQASTQLVQQDRLGRVLLVLPPDPPSRALYLLDHTKDRATITNDDLDWIVEHTEGYTFTDLQSLLDVALGIAAHTQSTPIANVDRNALRGARQAVSPSSAQWLSQAGHHALMGDKSGLYDDLLQYFHMRSR
jgi:hypothetical protein